LHQVGTSSLLIYIWCTVTLISNSSCVRFIYLLLPQSVVWPAKFVVWLVMRQPAEWNGQRALILHVRPNLTLCTSLLQPCQPCCVESHIATDRNRKPAHHSWHDCRRFPMPGEGGNSCDPHHVTCLPSPNWLYALICTTCLRHILYNTVVTARTVGIARCSGWLPAGRSGDRIPVEWKISTLLQAGPGAHPTSSTRTARSFYRV